MNEELVKTGSAGAVTHRKGPTGQEMQIGDALSTSSASAERAQIESAAALAQMRPPRDLDSFRVTMLRMVNDPAIAEQCLYSRPGGGRQKNPQTGEWEDVPITGPSIRLAEIAAQAYGKVFITTRRIYEDQSRVLQAATAYDLENVVVFSSDVMVDKTVERRSARQGQRVLGMRETSTGNTVYLIEASADEVRQKVAAERSKLIRDNVLRLIPRGIVDEVITRVKEVCASDAARDPAAAKKKIFDRFAGLGITPEMLKEYLDRSLDLLTAKDVAELTFIYNGLKQGDFVWPDLMATKAAEAEGEPKTEAGKKSATLKDKLMAARTEKTEPTNTTTETTTET